MDVFFRWGKIQNPETQEISMRKFAALSFWKSRKCSRKGSVRTCQGGVVPMPGFGSRGALKDRYSREFPQIPSSSTTIPEPCRLTWPKRVAINNSRVNSTERLWERNKGTMTQNEPFPKLPQGSRGARQQKVLIPHNIQRAMHILRENPLQASREGWH